MVHWSMAHTPQPHHVRIDGQGRVVIPSDLRRALRFSGGDELVARVQGEQLILERREAVIRRLKARYQGLEESLADELLAERRQEAAREARE
jgi:AbrB family looped-hinge helix DNA binding protein